MSDYDPRFDEDDLRRRRFDEDGQWREGSNRFLRWLKDRPAESWVFFAAGVVLGGLLF